MLLVGVLSALNALPASAQTTGTTPLSVAFLQTASGTTSNGYTINNNDGLGNQLFVSSAATFGSNSSFDGDPWWDQFYNDNSNGENLPYGNTPCTAGGGGCPIATAYGIWQYGITATNGLSAGDTITIGAPAGTILPASASDYTLVPYCRPSDDDADGSGSGNDWACAEIPATKNSKGVVTTPAVPAQAPSAITVDGPNSVTLTLPFSVSAGATFGLVAAPVTNPPELVQTSAAPTSGSTPSIPAYDALSFPVTTSLAPNAFPALPNAGLAFGSAATNQQTSTLTASAPYVATTNSSGVTLTATARDEYGNPVQGDSVVVEATSQGNDASLAAGTAPNPTTGSNGQVTYQFTDTVAQTVTFSAYDDTPNATPPAQFIFDQTATMSFVAGTPSANFSQVTASPATVQANGSATSTITVDLADPYDNPDVGQPIVLQAFSGSGGPPGVGVFSKGVITTTAGVGCATNVSGISGLACTPNSPTSVNIGGNQVSVAQVQFQVSDTVGETVNFGVEDLGTYSGGTFEASPFVATVTFGATSPTGSDSTVSPASQTVIANGTSQGTVTVTLKDAEGSPVPGLTVALNQTAGDNSTVTPVSIPDASSGCPTQSPAGTTDCLGRAQFAVSDGSVQTVTYTVSYTGTLPGTGGVSGSLSATATVTFVAGPASSSASDSTVTSSQSSLLANGKAQTVITVTLKDSSGQPTPGRVVSLAGTGSADVVPLSIPTTTSGCSSAAAAGTTDCAGQAQFALTDTTIETLNVGAVDETDQVTLAQTVPVAFTATPDAGTTTIVAGPPSTLEANGSASTTITVTLRDSSGQPIQGKQLCLSQSTDTNVPSSGPCPSPSSGPSSVTPAAITTSGCATQAQPGLTNCDGQATFTVTSTSPGTVLYGVIDTTDYPTGPPLSGVTATLTFTPVPTEAGLSTLVASPATALAGAAGTPSTATVTLLDANGNPISGHCVTLTATGAATVSPTSTGSCSTGQGQTGADGQTTFSVSDSTAQTVTLRATDKTAAVAVDETATVDFVPDEAAVSTVTATPSTASANGGATPGGVVDVEVTLDPGNPLAGDQVSLQVSGSASFTPIAIPLTQSNCSLPTPAGYSNCAGQVEFALTDTTPEKVVVSATDQTQSVTINQSATVDFLAPPPVIDGLSPSEGPTTGGTPVTISGTGLTAGGSNPTVTFGSLAATQVSCTSSTSCTATSPEVSAVGPVTVTVSNVDGPSTPAATGADIFTYNLPLPTLSAVSPSTGPVAGDTLVTLTGTGFGTTADTTVTFGTAPNAATVSPDSVNASGTSLTVTTPADLAGTYELVVTTPAGSTTPSSKLAFTFQAPANSGGGGGGGGGGTSSGGSGGGGAAPGGSGGSGSGTAPGGSGGSGTAVGGSVGVPVVSSLSVSSGVVGSRVVVYGSGFVNVLDVYFGNVPALAYTVISPDQIDVTVPAGATGSPAVTVATPGGVSALTNADVFNVSPLTASALGYRMVASDGGVFDFGTAQYQGSVPADHINISNIVGSAEVPGGGGYWLVASDGGVFTFGDAHFYGSMGGQHLNSPIVGMAATPDGGGYWLVASDGGIFTFGDAHFYGSTGNITLNKPIVAMTPSPDGGGYWLVASDGGIFTFGDLPFLGSTGNITLNKPIVAIAAVVG